MKKTTGENMRKNVLAFHHCDEIPKDVSFKRETFNLAYSFGGFIPWSADSTAVGLEPDWNTMQKGLVAESHCPKRSQVVEGYTQRTRPGTNTPVKGLSLATHFL